MPLQNELDIELPSVFFKQALTGPDPLWLAGGGWREEDFAQMQAASTALVAEMRSRFYSDVGVPPKPLFPYVVWDGRTDRSGCVTFNLPRDFTARKRAIYKVRRLDNFSAGQGSYSPARATYNNLKRCLCGVGWTPIQVNGVPLGTIVGTRWHDDWRSSYVDSDSESLTTELGFFVEVTYDSFD